MLKTSKTTHARDQMSCLWKKRAVSTLYAQKVRSMLSHRQRKRLHGSSHCKWSMSKIQKVFDVQSGVLYTVIEGKRHKCGYAQCSVCKTFQHVATHKCFIQPAVLRDDEEEETNDVSTVTSSDSDHERGKKRKPLPPLFVYA